jgi:hypothetical protein
VIDVLFITRLVSAEDAEAPEPKKFRLVLNGKTATIENLRRFANSSSYSETMSPDTSGKGRTSPPVLTSIHIKEFLKKHDISMVEIHSLEDDFEKMLMALKEGVRIIAICTTWLEATKGAVQLRKAVKLLKSLSPDTPLIVGGMGVLKGLRIRQLVNENKLTGIFPQWLEKYNFTRRLSSRLLRKTAAQHFLLSQGKADSCIDAIALDDAGEITIKNIVEAYKVGKDLHEIPNLAIPEDNDYSFTEYAETDIDLDSHIIDWQDYVSSLHGEEAPIRRGTGCPYKCAFCDFQGLQKLRVRSTESMIAELKTLTQTGYRGVHFVDDNIAYSKKSLAEFTKAIIDEHLELSWRSFLRADTIDVETASLLKNSGCKEIMMGVESGDPQVLINMNKRIDPEKVIKAIHCLDAEGIRSRCFFIVGFPGECSKSIENTASLISSFPSGDSARAFHRYYLLKFIVTPLSPVASLDMRRKYSLKGLGGSWSHSTMKSKEVFDAMRQLFLNVKGPSHLYVESIPADCDDGKIRKVIELRDAVQKERMRGHAGDLETLITAVRSI